MATNNARARAAREYVKAHPGTKYTEALRIVSQEVPSDNGWEVSPAERVFATMGLPGLGKSTDLVVPGWPFPTMVGEGHSLFSQYTLDASEGLTDLHLNRPSVTLTRIGGTVGTGKTFALMEHARCVSVPLRVVFSTTGEWTAAAASGTLVERPLSEGLPFQDEETRYRAFMNGVREAMRSDSRTMIVDLSGLNFPLPRGELGDLGLTWERLGMALLEAGPRFFEIILDGAFAHPASDGLPAVEGIINAVARNARSRGAAAHIIYTGYYARATGIPDVRAHWEVRGFEASTEPPHGVPDFFWMALFHETVLGRFWVEDHTLGGWDPVEVTKDGPVMLAFDRATMRYVPAHLIAPPVQIDTNVSNVGDEY